MPGNSLHALNVVPYLILTTTWEVHIIVPFMTEKLSQSHNVRGVPKMGP